MTPQQRSVVSIRRRMLTEVPPFRPVAVKLLGMVGNPAHLAQIVGLLRSDAVISTELIRAANSPLFPIRHEIKSPNEALVYLGLDRVRALVVTIALKAMFDAAHGKLKVACWRHNLAVALICQKLSGSVNLSSEACYMGGLIHDIGRLAFSKVFPEYEEWGMLTASGTQDSNSAERERFGLNHAEAGRWLLSQWECPIELQNVAGFHECPAEAPDCDRAVVGLVHAGSQLADLIGMSVFPCEPVPLPAITSALSEITGEELLVDVAEMAEWVASEVNGVEVSLS
jgi:putative nucleotidyltransferase with HDIG domain